MIAPAIPYIVSIVGSMLPIIMDSFRGGRSPEEAARLIAPKRDALLQQMLDSGMKPEQASLLVDLALKGELERAQIPEQMSPFLTATMSILGAVGGFKGGQMLAKRYGNAAAPPAASAASRGTAIPEFMPGEANVVPRASAKSLAPWEDLPEIKAAIGRVSQRMPTGTATDISQMGKSSPFASLTPSADDAMLMEKLAELIRRRQMGAAQALRRNQFRWQGESPAMAREMGQPVMGDVI